MLHTVFDKNRHWRVALLITTLLMGAALLGTGISGYLQATQNAEVLIRSEVVGLTRGLRHELRGVSQPTEAIQSYFEDNKDQGLHYLGLLNRRGELLKEFGEYRRPFSRETQSSTDRELRFSTPPPGPQPGLAAMSIYEDGLVHTHFRLAGPGRRRRNLFRSSEDMPWSILVEAMSQNGATMVNQALVALSIEIIASLLLLGATILFWRLSVKQEKMAAKMEKEKLEMVTALEADKRLKSLGRMSAVLGHELKNPIASLKGNAQLLLEKLSENDNGYKQAETVVQEAILLERLTQEILDYVRTGKLNYSKVYLDDLAESAVDLSNVSHVHIVVQESVFWNIDRERMEQVLVNLLTNARQSSRLDALIDLALNIDEVTKQLVIVVRDRGEGINEAEKEQLFEPFFTRRTQGTGLGLPLAKQIVESHGGKIDAENHRDGGAMFKITLPSHSIETKEW